MAKHQVTMSDIGLTNFFIERIEQVEQIIGAEGGIQQPQIVDIANNMKDFTLSLLDANKTIPVNEPLLIEIYAKILAWLFSNHDAFANAKDWRVAFVGFLETTLNIKLDDKDEN